MPGSLAVLKRLAEHFVRFPMAGKGIDHETCPKAHIARFLWTETEKAFTDILMKAFQKKVNAFIKVRVLDVIELDSKGRRPPLTLCWELRLLDVIASRRTWRSRLSPLINAINRDENSKA